jgi:predicted N-acetyltransferase YhbS
VGNDLLARLGYPLIVVVGHPNFYPRFGFRPAARRRLRLTEASMSTGRMACARSIGGNSCQLTSTVFS